MAVTTWDFPSEGNLRVPINLDSDSYIVAADESGVTQAKNTNINGIWKVPTTSDTTANWARSLCNVLYMFGIESDIYGEEETEYAGVQFSITLKDQELSTEERGN